MVTQYQQGALGGGGYCFELNSSPDGSIRFARGDTPNAYRWDRSSGLWKNISTSPYMDGLDISIESFSQPKAVAVGPDNLTVYMVAPVLPQRVGYLNTGGGYTASDHGQLYRSNDGGQTWFKPGSANPATDPLRTPISMSGNGHHYQGPAMCVDPNNKEVVYIMAYNGAVWVSYDGGVTLTLLRSLMQAALPSCYATANCTVGLGAITVDSNPVAGNQPGLYAAFDADHPFAFGGGSGYSDGINAFSTATQFILFSPVQKNDGTFGNYGDPGVIGNVVPGLGDQIFFGQFGCVVVDGSTGTIANPGGSGVISNVVYFGWYYGASSMWWTQDGGATFAAMAGSPPNIGSKVKLSRDATLGGGGNNVLYVSTGGFGGSTSFWRWVRQHPAPSGSAPLVLADNTWTHLPISCADGGIVACPDPLQQGKVVFVSLRGGSSYCVNDYGTTDPGSWCEVNQTLPVRLPGDAPWLQTDQISLGDAEFDPVVSNKLWIANGVGVWTCFPPNPSVSIQPTWTVDTQDLQSLILNFVLKVPSPSNKIVLSQAQDRPIVVCDDIDTPPDGYYPGATVDNLGGQACYSLNDPTQIFCAYANLVIQYAGGSSGGIQNWTTIATANQNGYTPYAAGSSAMMVSRTSTEIFIVMNNVQFDYVHIQYGTKSGGIWTWRDTIYNNADGSLAEGIAPVTYYASISYPRRFIYPSLAEVPPLTGAGPPTPSASIVTEDIRISFRANRNAQVTTPICRNPLLGIGSNFVFKARCVDIDRVSGIIYYLDRNIGSLYVSTDGGATLTRPGAAGSALSRVSNGNYGVAIAAVPGKTGHVFIVNGYSGGGALNPVNGDIYFTNDSGVTWHTLGLFSATHGLCVGVAAPGGSYPTIYALGNLITDSSLLIYSVYRCTDFNPTTFTGTWENIGEGLKTANCEGMLGGLHNDPETYGSFYMGTSDTGYVAAFEEVTPSGEAGGATITMTNTYGKFVSRRVKMPHA